MCAAQVSEMSAGTLPLRSLGLHINAKEGSNINRSKNLERSSSEDFWKNLRNRAWQPPQPVPPRGSLELP